MASLYRTCRAVGMTMPDVLDLLLDQGRTPFHAILEAVEDKDELLALGLACISDGITDPLATLQALAGKDIHPLTLAAALAQEDRQALIAAHPGLWSDRRSPLSLRDARHGILISGYRPPAWLSPGIRRFWAGKRQRLLPSITFLDCDLAGLEVTGPYAELHLNQCRGEVRLDGDAEAHLSMLASRGVLRFPGSLDAAFLELRDCHRTEALPRALGSRRVLAERCPQLEVPPDRWPHLEHLVMSELPLPSLPGLPTCLKTLQLSRMPELRVLRLHKGSQLDLHLDTLPALETLEAPQVSFGDVFITQCRFLERLPQSIARCRNLTLMHLPNLQTLPPLQVEGRQRIIDCPRLQR